MKRFSRKSSRRKSTPKSVTEGETNDKSTPTREISRFSLMRSFRKKLQRTPTIPKTVEQHVYCSSPDEYSPAPGIQLAPPIFNNNSNSSAIVDAEYSSPVSGRLQSQAEHDYSLVSSEEQISNEILTGNTANSIHIYENEPDSASNDRTPPVKNSKSCGGVTSHPLSYEFQKLARKGWYWGPLTREQAEKQLLDLPEASFLVRDSSDARYILSLSFRSNNRTLHTRIEHSGFKFSFYEDNPTQWYTSVIDLIENSVKDSNEQGVFCYSRSRHPNAQTFPVRLMHPVSRFTEVRPLQDLCRFVIRQSTRVDHIQNLPVPKQIKGYLNESYF